MPAIDVSALKPVPVKLIRNTASLENQLFCVLSFAKDFDGQAKEWELKIWKAGGSVCVHPKHPDMRKKGNGVLACGLVKHGPVVLHAKSTGPAWEFLKTAVPVIDSATGEAMPKTDQSAPCVNHAGYLNNFLGTKCQSEDYRVIILARSKDDIETHKLFEVRRSREQRRPKPMGRPMPRQGERQKQPASGDQRETNGNNGQGSSGRKEKGPGQKDTRGEGAGESSVRHKDGVKGPKKMGDETVREQGKKLANKSTTSATGHTSPHPGKKVVNPSRHATKPLHSGASADRRGRLSALSSEWLGSSDESSSSTDSDTDSSSDSSSDLEVSLRGSKGQRGYLHGAHVKGAAGPKVDENGKMHRQDKARKEEEETKNPKREKEMEEQKQKEKQNKGKGKAETPEEKGKGKEREGAVEAKKQNRAGEAIDKTRELEGTQPQPKGKERAVENAADKDKTGARPKQGNKADAVTSAGKRPNAPSTSSSAAARKGESSKPSTAQMGTHDGRMPDSADTRSPKKRRAMAAFEESLEDNPFNLRTTFDSADASDADASDAAPGTKKVRNEATTSARVDHEPGAEMAARPSGTHPSAASSSSSASSSAMTAAAVTTTGSIPPPTPATLSASGVHLEHYDEWYYSRLDKVKWPNFFRTREGLPIRFWLGERFTNAIFYSLASREIAPVRDIDTATIIVLDLEPGQAPTEEADRQAIVAWEARGRWGAVVNQAWLAKTLSESRVMKVKDYPVEGVVYDDEA